LPSAPDFLRINVNSFLAELLGLFLFQTGKTLNKQATGGHYRQWLVWNKHGWAYGRSMLTTTRCRTILITHHEKFKASFTLIKQMR